jgi:hypothetical protein
VLAEHGEELDLKITSSLCVAVHNAEGKRVGTIKSDFQARELKYIHSGALVSARLRSRESSDGNQQRSLTLIIKGRGYDDKAARSIRRGGRCNSCAHMSFIRSCTLCKL